MVFGLDFLSELFGPNIPGYKSVEPGRLIARAGRVGVRSERDMLLSTFGFEDTISDPERDKDLSRQQAPEKVRKKTKRNTLL